MLATQMLSLPARVYRDVWLERRYFSRTTEARHWGRRALIAAALTATGGGLLLGTTLWLWQRMPDGWWLVAGGLLVCGHMVWALAVPALVIPRLATLAPLSRDSLSARVSTLAARLGGQAPRMLRWTVDGHPDRAQAALVGMGGARCILLSEGLLEAYSDDEIEVVVAHELAHAAHGDVRLTLAVQGALTLVGLGGLAHIWPQVASWLGASTPPTAEHVSALVLAGWAWQGVTAPVLHALARQQERRADAFALAVTGRPDAFLTALRRLRQEHLADDSAPALVYWWTQSHPRIAERVAMAEAFTRQSSSRATLSGGRM
jgi:STE24 endopeptidase